MEQSKKYLFFLLFLVSVFTLYNFNIYTSESNYGSVHLSKKAMEGENIWLQNNCNSCHQLYGLGGYLGPDLTNVYSTNGKGETYIKAMLNSGIKSMPKFNFNDSDIDKIIQFLKEVDQTGYYPNLDAQFQKNGWVDIKYKTSNNAKE